MDIIQKVEKKFGKIPFAIQYTDLCKLLEKEAGSITVLDSTIFAAAETLAKKSQRKRFLILLHRNSHEKVHRMINTMLRGTYAMPHIHKNKETFELFSAVRGKAYVIIFTKGGKIKENYLIEANKENNIVEIEPGEIHTVLPLTPVFITLEIKGQSNYDPGRDKSFFPWAPKETDSQEKVGKYLEKLYEEVDRHLK